MLDCLRFKLRGIVKYGRLFSISPGPLAKPRAPLEEIEKKLYSFFSLALVITLRAGFLGLPVIPEWEHPLKLERCERRPMDEGPRIPCGEHP